MVWPHIFNKVRKKKAKKVFSDNQIMQYYSLEGHADIDGWLSPNSLSLIHLLDKFQSLNDYQGSIAEIGVFHGRFFIGLCLLMRIGDKALAIDVFGDQQFNLDKSGEGDLVSFTTNLMTKLGPVSENIEIIQSDSKIVTSKQIFTALGGGVRLFSVDGCHTSEHTESDLLLAAKSLSHGGVIILDDFENEDWPGVLDGVSRFLQKDKEIVPIALAYNKLYLTAAKYSHSYSEYLENVVSGQTGSVEYIDVCGHKTLKVLISPPESIYSEAFLQFIDFSSIPAAGQYLTEGWFPSESWGVWSDSQKRAVVEVENNFQGSADVMMIISFHVFVARNFPQREISIFINSEKIETVVYQFGVTDYLNWKYVIPTDFTCSRKISIEFEVNDMKSPSDLGLSEDKRKLGVGLRNIRFF